MSKNYEKEQKIISYAKTLLKLLASDCPGNDVTVRPYYEQMILGGEIPDRDSLNDVRRFTYSRSMSDDEYGINMTVCMSIWPKKE